MTERSVIKPAMPMWKRITGFAVVGVLLAGLLAALITPAVRNAPSPLVGKAATPFTLELLSGGQGSLSAYRGRVIVLNFWGSWCVPCRAEAPALREFAARYASRGAVLIGVTVKDKPDDARAFLAEFNLTNPNFYDADGRIGVLYGLTGVPETYIIDREGVIRHKYFGPISFETLEQKVKEYL